LQKLFKAAAESSARQAAILVNRENSGARAEVFHLPKLETVRTTSPLVSRAAVGDVDVWRDEHGAVCAHGFFDGPRHWMELPGIASFSFTQASRSVKAFAHFGIASSLIRDAYRRSVLPMAVQARGWEVLHSSAVRTSRGVIALCGLSGVGKSTLAYALSLRGHLLWADDAVAYDPTSLTAVALPFHLRLRLEPARYFAASCRTTRSDLVGSRARIDATFVLTRHENRRSRCLRLSPAEAFPIVLKHAYCFTLGNAQRKREMISNYLHFCGAVPVYELHVRDGLANVPAVVELVERTLEVL